MVGGEDISSALSYTDEVSGAGGAGYGGDYLVYLAEVAGGDPIGGVG